MLANNNQKNASRKKLVAILYFVAFRKIILKTLENINSSFVWRDFSYFLFLWRPVLCLLKRNFPLQNIQRFNFGHESLYFLFLLCTSSFHLTDRRVLSLGILFLDRFFIFPNPFISYTFFSLFRVYKRLIK